MTFPYGRHYVLGDTITYASTGPYTCTETLEANSGIAYTLIILDKPSLVKLMNWNKDMGKEELVEILKQVKQEILTRGDYSISPALFQLIKDTIKKAEGK